MKSMNSDALTNISTQSVTNGALKILLPELYELKSNYERNDWHDETTFHHTVAVLHAFESVSEQVISKLGLSDTIDGMSKKDAFKLTILLHDCAKPESLLINPDGTTFFPGHEQKGAIKAAGILQRLQLPESVDSYILQLIEHHGKPHVILSNRETMYHNLKQLEQQSQGFYSELLLLAMVDTMGSKLAERDPSEFAFRMEVYSHQLSLDSK